MILVQSQAKVIYFQVANIVSTVVLGKGNAGGFNANGTYDLNGSFSESQLFCRVNLSTNDTDTIGPLDVLAWDSANNCIGTWHGVVLADYPSTGDPWAKAVPAGYAAGTAGSRVGNSLSNTSVILDQPTLDLISTNLLLLANSIENGITVQGALQLILAGLTGKLAIAGSTVTIRDINDLVNRIIATTDAAGQRLAVSHFP